MPVLFIIATTSIHCISSPNPRLGKPAPDFQLQDIQGNIIQLSSMRGKVVLLNFWASWCQPCRYEMPSLEKFYQKYKNKNFVVLAVSLDEEGWDAIKSFTQKIPISFPVVVDQNMQVSTRYQTYRIPETFLIDVSGKIVDQFTGPQDFESPVFSQKIENLLKN